MTDRPVFVNSTPARRSVACTNGTGALTRTTLLRWAKSNDNEDDSAHHKQAESGQPDPRISKVYEHAPCSEDERAGCVYISRVPYPSPTIVVVMSLVPPKCREHYHDRDESDKGTAKHLTYRIVCRVVHRQCLFPDVVLIHPSR